MHEIEYLRKLYLADLGKIVNYGGKDRPRVRHVGNWEQLTSQVKLKEGLDDYVDPTTLHDKVDNVWIWSDLHFFHKNIIAFSERPYADVDEMNEHLVANHNDYVQPDDICIWVGDVGFGKDSKINEVLDQCNGYKILIVGNHDFNKRKLRDLNFDEIHLLYQIPTQHGDLVLTHYPMENIEDPWFNIHGHLHAFPKLDTGHPLHYNVNCEGHGYRPISLKQLINDVNLQKINNLP